MDKGGLPGKVYQGSVCVKSHISSGSKIVGQVAVIVGLQLTASRKEIWNWQLCKLNLAHKCFIWLLYCFKMLPTFKTGKFHIKTQISGFPWKKLERPGNTGLTFLYDNSWLNPCHGPSTKKEHWSLFTTVPTALSNVLSSEPIHYDLSSCL